MHFPIFPWCTILKILCIIFALLEPASDDPKKTSECSLILENLNDFEVLFKASSPQRYHDNNFVRPKMHICLNPYQISYFASSFTHSSRSLSRLLYLFLPFYHQLFRSKQLHQSGTVYAQTRVKSIPMTSKPFQV